MEILLKLIQTEDGWKASIGEGTPDEITKEATTSDEALTQLTAAMNAVLLDRTDIPGGWVGVRPNDR
jgi:hypothetical protein